MNDKSRNQAHQARKARRAAKTRERQKQHHLRKTEFNTPTHHTTPEASPHIPPTIFSDDVHEVMCPAHPRSIQPLPSTKSPQAPPNPPPVASPLVPATDHEITLQLELPPPTAPLAHLEVRRASQWGGRASLPFLDSSADPIWLWPGRLRRGEVALLAGDHSSGKSFVACDLTARLSAGRPLPDAPSSTGPSSSGPSSSGPSTAAPPTPAEVLLIVGPEADPDALRRRLSGLQGDLSQIHLLQHGLAEAPSTNTLDHLFELDRDLEALWQYLKNHPRIQLAILDSFDRLVGSRTSTAAIRRSLNRLHILARSTGVTVLLTKSFSRLPRPGQHLRCLGSLALADSLSTIWGVVQPTQEGDPDQLTPSHRLVPLKLNDRESSTSLDFTLREGRVDWLGRPRPCETRYHGYDPVRARGREELSAVEEAVMFLRKLLTPGPLPTPRIRAESNQSGIAWRTLQRAKNRLEVTARPERSGEVGSWSWWLPGTPTVRPPEPAPAISPSGSHGEAPSGPEAPASDPPTLELGSLVALGVHLASEPPPSPEEMARRCFVRAAERGFAKIRGQLMHVGVAQAFEFLNLIAALPNPGKWTEALSQEVPTPHIVALRTLTHQGPQSLTAGHLSGASPGRTLPDRTLPDHGTSIPETSVPETSVPMAEPAAQTHDSWRAVDPTPPSGGSRVEAENPSNKERSAESSIRPDTIERTTAGMGALAAVESPTHRPANTAGVINRADSAEPADSFDLPNEPQRSLSKAEKRRRYRQRLELLAQT